MFVEEETHMKTGKNWKPFAAGMLTMAMMFGVFQAGMFIAGWTLGDAFKDFMESWDHWLAFGILSILGIKMIVESRKNNVVVQGKTLTTDWRRLLLLSIATSIDAFAVGIVFIAENSSSFGIAAFMIGCGSFSLTIVGHVIGANVGCKLPFNAELIGGGILIGIGIKILNEHIGLLNYLYP